MPRAPPAPRRPRAPRAPRVPRAPRRHKAVTFCAHRADPPSPPPSSPSPRDASYYSDPGRERKPARKKEPQRSDSTDSDVRYYSEPDAKYFEIDYEFLKELRRIARNNCPACRRRRTRDKPARARSSRAAYVYCGGRYHAHDQHCRACCRVCARSSDTRASHDDDQYALVSRSYSRPAPPAPHAPPAPATRSASTPRRSRERRPSIQSNKSVSFLESSNDESIKDEPNYTAKSFTNDLKKFLLKPSTPRLSLRDKFITSFKQEFEATRKSPKLRAIKGLWKSY